MVESAPRSALLQTGETTTDASTTECLRSGDGGNGRHRQLQQTEKLGKTEVGSAGRVASNHISAYHLLITKVSDFGEIQCGVNFKTSWMPIGNVVTVKPSPVLRLIGRDLPFPAQFYLRTTGLGVTGSHPGVPSSHWLSVSCSTRVPS